MLSINISTPSSVMGNLSNKFKQLRLQKNLTQSGLATRSGVSLGSIKRFESIGKISLESLLKISVTLDCLDDFNLVANIKEPEITSLNQLLSSKEKPAKLRGAIK